MVFGKIPREFRAADELGTPSSLSQTLLKICSQIDTGSSAVSLEDVSNLLFEGNCHFALAFNTSAKSYLNSFEVLKWLSYGAMDPKRYLELHPNVERAELRCGEMWKGTHVAYRCSTCGISENSCMCVGCFDEELHQGHDYRIYSSTVGGCCDCGDEQAWRPEGFCKRHSPTAVAAIELDSTIVDLSTKACTIAAYHLFRSLHRMFQRGLTKPQDAKSPASFQVLKSLEFFTTMANNQRETRLGVCNAFSTRLQSSFASLANATSRTMYLPTFTLTEVLLNVCCFLPHGLCKDAEMLLLKLIMEPTYKPGFQADFVRYYPKFLQVARECNQNQTRPVSVASANRIAIRANLEAVYGNAVQREMFESACQVLDGLYCQLFHNEEVSMEFAPQVLLAAFGQLALPQSPLKYGFYSRAFSEIHSLLAFPSICRIIVRNETLFQALLMLLQSAEEAVPEIQNEMDIYPFYVLLEEFILTPVCAALDEDLDEALRFDMLKQCALALPKLPPSIHIPLTRFYLRCGTAKANKQAVLRCASALQEMFLFEHAKNASMGTYLAARYKRTFLQIDLQCLAKHNFLDLQGFVWQEPEYELRLLGALTLLQQQQEETQKEDDLKQRLIHVLASKQPCAFSEIELGRGDYAEDRVSQLLQEIADQSKQVSPIQFTLKTEYWRQVEFGGFYLPWTLKDEEEAMQAYRKHFKLTSDAVFPVADRFRQAAAVTPSARLTELCESVLRTGDVRCKTMALLVYMLFQGKPAEVSSEWNLDGVCKNLYAAEEEEKTTAVTTPAHTPQPQNPAQAKALKALAKKQRNFALQMQQLEAEQAKDDEHSDDACCVLCKDSGDESLHLLILCKDSTAAQNREMVYWQGQSRGVAVSLMDKHIPTDSTIHATSLHDAGSTTHNKTFWQSKFFAKLQSARAQWSNTHVESTVLHTCNHAVHKSCLTTYRSSLAARAAKREHFEGENVIVLELGEVVCPVCRRVANDVMPLSSQAIEFLPSSSTLFDDWFAFNFARQPAAAATQAENPTAASNKPQFDAFVKRFDCLAELVVAQLEVDSLALPELLALCMENRTTAREHWNHVLAKRFSGEGRECALHTDLIVVFVEWLFVDEQVNVEHMYNVLLPFARVQDMLFNALASASDDDEPSLFENDNEAELLGALELLKQQLPAHRTVAAVDVTLAAKALVGDEDATAAEFSKLTKKLVRLHAFPPRTRARESFVDRLTRLCEKLTGRQLAAAAIETSVPHMQDLLQRALRGFFREASKSWDESKCDASAVRFVDTANQLHLWSLLPPVFTREISALIALPQEYSSLTVGFLGRQCVCIKCKTKPDNPALCLSCGMMLCLRSTCCHEGAYGPITSDLDEFLLDEVFTHAQRTCSRGGKTSSSVFLVLKNGAVLVVLSEARFNLFGTLYLDAHQEEDLFLSRGKPLLLSADKLAKLEQLQTSQRWFHDSKILESTRVLAFHHQ